MKHTWKRLLSVVLTLTMLSTMLVPMASAAEVSPRSNWEKLKLTPVDPSTLELPGWETASEKESISQEEYKLTDTVRVSIVLDKASTVDAGFSLENIGRNADAVAYRNSLKAEQADMTSRIEAATGSTLDVKWNITLAANMISANVLYGNIEKIKAVPGVADVIIENRYELNKLDFGSKALPNMGPSSQMIGSNMAWAEGYTGAGSKVAVIDTGADLDHQSFSPEGLEYAYEADDLDTGMLMTQADVDAVASQLNVSVTGAQAYKNTKVPYAYNYVDKNADDVIHLNDTQGEHGSHVSGIATGNRFIKVAGEWKDALSAVGTQGVAPDAQLVVMKVFGKGGGAYDSDYMVAIEDAIVLGCDSANLSLGSGNAGLSFSDQYEAVMNKLVENGLVVVMSAGNSYSWYNTPYNPDMYPYLYTDDVNYATGGSPGSFTNSLAVASVDNAGQTGMPIYFEVLGEDHPVFYSETSGYGNDPISTLAGKDLQYVFVDGPGVLNVSEDPNSTGEEFIGNPEYDAFAALGSDVISGKIAICYRGSSSFYVKANAAAAQGAVGVIIVNNQDGVINMNLTGYKYSVPAVSILKADGDALKAASEVVEGETGSYYTGTLKVSESILVQEVEPSDTVTMSEFSSWGVPGTLVLKPEITAPGGSIYSVWGANRGPDSPTEAHDQYEVMSGTSMAAPQVAGMAAVLGQYIRDNGLEEKTGLTARQLINSLLMSTSVPVYDEEGEYWPIMKQGSGLGNVNAATQAKSYILMDEDATMFPDSAKDGKVKAELGDDPDWTGTYSFGFTINPLGDETVEYNLATEIFTQWLAGDAGYGMLQYTGTTLIGADVTYEVDGEPFEPYVFEDHDVNKDGKTDAADAQAILDYLSGKNDGSEYDLEVADTDGDEKITTVDAREILLLAAQEAIVVKDKPVHVTVNIQLDPGDVEFLSYYFTNGFYVEGFTYLEGITTGEGEIVDVTHSIPILGFCGNWSDPSMFDRTSVIDEAYGTGKLSYLNNSKTNYMTLKNQKGKTSIYMGNPFTVEEEFPADRLAINGKDTVSQFNYLPIRNIGSFTAAIQDENGRVLWLGNVNGNRYSAYYYVNGARWENTSPVNYNVNKTLASAGLQEGDKATVGFYALPEYYAVKYAKDNGSVAASGTLDAEGFKAVLESGAVGTGAGISYTVTVDNTAPKIDEAKADQTDGSNKILVRASDNEYIAWVALTNNTGSKVFIETVPEADEPGQTVEVVLDPAEAKDAKLPATALLVVGDYAGNVTAMKIETGEEPEDFTGQLIGFDYTGKNRWVELDIETLSYNKNTKVTTGADDFSESAVAFTAAEYVNGVVYAASDDGYLYAADIHTLDEASRFGKYSDVTSAIYDMTYDAAGGTLYALGTENTVYTVDTASGGLTEAFTVGGMGSWLNTLAVDAEGTFYSINAAGKSSTRLYTFTAETADSAVEVGAVDVFFNKGGALTWDTAENKLYATANYSTGFDYDNCLYLIDTATGKAEKVNDLTNTPVYGGATGFCVYGLFYVNNKGDAVTPAEEATGLTVDPASVTVLKGQTIATTADVYPWTLEDKTVTYESADETIATVDGEGSITGVNVGETTVTVTTNAEPHLTATIAVTVENAPEAELRGIIWDEGGKGQASVFSTNDTENWEAVSEVGQLRWGALVDDQVYGSTDDTLYVFDADTYEVTPLGGIVSMWIPSDAVGFPAELVEGWGITGRVGGICNNGTYFEVLNPEAGNLNYWDLTTTYSEDPMAVIAFVSYTPGESAICNMLTESGKLWKFEFDAEGNLSRTEIGETGIDLTGASDVTNETWASMVYDAEKEYLYLSLYNGEDDFAHLYAIDAGNPATNADIGNFRADVWPVVGLYEYVPATDLVLKVDPADVTLFVGETEQLNIKVKLGETNEYTIKNSDPSVATVDDSGLITAVKEGTTAITVTTADKNKAGEQLSKTVNVTVIELVSIDTSIIAQVSDEEGDHFVSLSLAGLSYEPKADAPAAAKSGTRAGDIYVADINSTPKFFDAETFEETDWTGDVEVLSVMNQYFDQFPPLDMADYPAFINSNGTLVNKKVLYPVEQGYLITPDTYGWNIGPVVGDMAALAFLGTDKNSDGADVFDYLVLNMEGDLYLLQINYTGGSIDYMPFMSTGIKVANQSDASMAFLDDESACGLVIADNGTKNVWFIDIKTGEVGLCGTVDCVNISGLVGTYDELASVAGEIEEPEPDPLDEAASVVTFDFEEDPASSWTFVDSDDDGYNWEWANDNTVDYTYQGNGCIKSASYVGSVGALNPDNWAISPAIDLSDVSDSDKPTLSLFARGQDPSYAAEVFALYAGTSADPASMTKISEDFTATGDYIRYTADLSDYARESKVYVAVRHYNVTDMFRLNVDKVEILIPNVIGSNSAAPKSADLSKYAAPSVNFSKIGDSFAKLNTEESALTGSVQMERLDGFDAVEAAPVSDYETRITAEANRVTGGLNAIRGEQVRPNAAREVEPAEDDDANTLAVELYEEEASTNGKLTVTYDPAKLTVKSVTSGLEYHSYNDNNGTITFTYANVDEIPAVTALAVIKFTYTFEEEDGISAEVTVTTEERSDDTAVEEDPVVIKLLIYGAPEWTWNDTAEPPTATAVFGEGEDATEKNGTVVLKKTIDPTCTEDGKKVYIASVEQDGKTWTSEEHEVVVKAIGHDWGEPEWNWVKTESGYTATATFVCSNDETHVKTVDATVTFNEEESIEATPVKEGTNVYDATVEFEGKTYSDTKTDVLQPTGYTYGDPEWEWTQNEDGTYSVVATFTSIEKNPENVVPVTAAVTVKVIPADCGIAGKTVYTAVATFGGKDYTDTKEVEIPALSHKWGEPVWKWSADGKSAVVTFTCETNPSHVLTYTAIVTLDEEQSYEATTEKDGQNVYTATAIGPDGETYTDTKTVTIPKIQPVQPVKPTEPTLPVIIPPIINLPTNPVGDPRPTKDPVIQIPGQTPKTVSETNPETPAIPAVINDLPFTDVNLSDSFYGDVKFVFENGIMNGISAVEFAPNSTLTRAMIVTILYRVEGQPEVAFAGTFSDVEAGEWYSDAVEWAAANGIVKGYGNGEFGPTDAVTLEQLAAILNRYAAFKGYEINTAEPVNGEVSAWAAENVSWAAANGILALVESYVRPALRSEVATAIHAFCVNVAK